MLTLRPASEAASRRTSIDDRRLVGLQGRVEVDQAGNLLQLRGDLLRQPLELAEIGALDRELQALAAAEVGQADVGDRDPRNPRQALAQGHRHLGDAAHAILAVDQAHVGGGVDLAGGLAAVDRGHGVADLGHLAQHRVDLPGPHLGHLERGADRRVEVDLGLGEVGLRHELGAEHRDDEEAADEGRQGDAERRQPVLAATTRGSPGTRPRGAASAGRTGR